MEKSNSQGDSEAVDFKLLEKVIVFLHSLLKRIHLKSLGQSWALRIREI